jgi:cell division protein FtsQ
MAKTSQRHHLKWWLISLVIVISIAAGITWLVQTTSAAVVSSVEVQVAERAMARNISNVAAIEAGERITDLNLTAAAARVTQLPQVRTATVARRWPDRIVISVELREPIGWVRTANKIWYLDVTGEKYDPAVSVAAADLPEFVVRGDRVLADVALAYAQLPAAQRKKIDRITAPTSSNIRFVLKNQVTIIWGSAERSERKAEVLTVLLQRKAKVYDVSAPDLPTIRLK